MTVFRHYVLLSVVNSHMGPLRAKFRANFFPQAWNPSGSFLIFQQFSPSQPSFFPESKHPVFELHVTNITHHSGGTDEGDLSLLNRGRFFPICLSSSLACGHRFSPVTGSVLTLLMHSFTLISRYRSSTSYGTGTILDFGDTPVDIIMQFAF